MAKIRNTAPRDCEQCGQSFSIFVPEAGWPKRFCSNQCRSTAKERRRGKRQMNRQCGPCSVVDCDRSARTKSLCLRHYQHLRVHGYSTKPCTECGTQTTTTYCTPECRKAGTQRIYTENQRAKGVRPISEEVARRKAEARR